MKLLESIKFFSLLFALLILLFVIYYSTHRKHYTNEFFTLSEDMLSKSLTESDKQKIMSDKILENSKRNLQHVAAINRERWNSRNYKIRNLRNLKRKTNTFDGEQKITNQLLYKIRNGDPDIEGDPGVFHATLMS